MERTTYKPRRGIGLYIPPEEDLSLADKVARLSPEEQDEVFKDMDMDKLQYDFSFWGRPSQLAAVNSDKWLTVLMSGRGFGKTRVLAEAMHKKAMDMPGCRMALVGRSVADVRDILVLGESGVMSVTDPDERPEYKQTVRRLIWPNGSEAMTFTADIPDQLRGPQFHASFGDELGSWRVKATGTGMVNAWSQLQIATRLGDNPQIFIATTPRRVPMIVDCVKMADYEPDRVLLIRGSTFANRHLGTKYREAIIGLYEGTTLGQQELEGELLSDVEGALLTPEVIENSRLTNLEDTFWKTLPNRIVGVDPTVSATPGDECGIVVAGATGEKKMYNRRAYVLEDASLQGPPEVWARRVVEMARKYRAAVVAEDNQGGEMVRMVINAQDPRVPVTLVKSKAGKYARAEPVAHAYQQGRVHHLREFDMLEDQLTTWVPDEGMKSPDRLDACLVKNTAVTMADGTSKPIQDVQVGDYVQTRQGAKRVLASEQTSKESTVYAVEFSNGGSLVGTGNHPVWSETRKEFVPIDALVHDMILTCQSAKRAIPSKLSTAEWFTNETLSLHREHIEFITQLLEDQVAEIFIETSMKMLTDDSNMGCMCITETATRSTTNCRILKQSLQKSMVHAMPKSSENLVGNTCWTKSSQLQLSGTNQTLEKNYTDVSVKNPGTIKSSLIFLAVNAVMSADEEQGSNVITCSATLPVGHDGGKIVQTLNSVSVSSAEKRSRSEKTCQETSADLPVETYVVGVKSVNEKQPVWNLEVEDAHEYFANGVLVHNCVHALTALVVVKPKEWIGGVTIAGTGTRRRINVIDHDPYQQIVPGSNGPGNTRAKVLERLRPLDGFNIEEFDGTEEETEEEKQQFKRLRRANRSPRLPIHARNRKYDPYSAPRIRRRQG